MAEYIQSPSPQNVAYGQNLLLIDSIPCPNHYVVHRNGSGILTLRGATPNCFARYQVTFNGNIAIPTGGTVGAIAIGLAEDGEALPYSRAIVTPAAVEQYFNVTSTAIITVLRGCCTTISVQNIDPGVGTILGNEQTISVADGNLTVSRIA